MNKQKRIGDTFKDELRAAGLIGLGLTWGEDGSINYGNGVTPGQRQQVEALLAAHDPTKKSAAVERARLVKSNPISDDDLREFILAVKDAIPDLPKLKAVDAAKASGEKR